MTLRCGHDPIASRPALVRIEDRIGWEFQASNPPRYPWVCSFCGAVDYLTHEAAIDARIAVLMYDNKADAQ